MLTNIMQILDCTFRDGGYYTNWDFNQTLVDDYCKLVKSLPISIVELGYRGNINKKDNYYGEYYFLTISNLKKIKSIIGKEKKLSVMIDLKDWQKEQDLKKNLNKCKGIVDIVRFAINPKKIRKIKKFLKVAKLLGFKVAVNLMYSHLFLSNPKIIKEVLICKKFYDILYIVDSYGTLISGDVEKLIKQIKDVDSKIPIGFHAHNNLEMALSNSLEAIKNKIDYVDCTFTGMGRGAGNLKTELLLTFLNLKLKQMKINDYRNIAKVVGQFEEIRAKEKWGTSLPYMISGATQTPQSQAMQLIRSKRYNLGDIITYLSKEKTKKISVKKKLSFKRKNILIVGGGYTVKKNLFYINEFLKKIPDIFVIFSSTRNFKLLNNIKNDFIICITGNEISKINTNINKVNFLINDVIDDKTILPKNLTNFLQLTKNKVDKKLSNSPLSISLSATSELKGKNIYLVGFDGYEQSSKINDYSLYNENQQILDFYKKKLNLISLTDTTYEGIQKHSIFQYLN